MILVKATNTSTKTRYPFATVKSEDVKVSETRLPAKTLATRMSCGVMSVDSYTWMLVGLTFVKVHTSKI